MQGRMAARLPLFSYDKDFTENWETSIRFHQLLMWHTIPLHPHYRKS